MKTDSLKLFARIFEFIDRPVSAAIQLARGRPFVLLVLATSGAALCSLSTAAVHAMTPLSETPRVVTAIFTAYAIALPTLIVLAGFFRITVSPRVLVASAAIALFIAGIVCTLILPFFLFLSLLAQPPWWANEPMPGLIVFRVGPPLLILALLSWLPTRVLKVCDGRVASRGLGLGFSVLMFCAFGLRISRTWGGLL